MGKLSIFSQKPLVDDFLASKVLGKVWQNSIACPVSFFEANFTYFKKSGYF